MSASAPSNGLRRLLIDRPPGNVLDSELCDELRQIDRFAKAPFILATAAGIDPTNLENIDAFLVKPYEVETLIKFVSRQLESALS